MRRAILCLREFESSGGDSLTHSRGKQQPSVRFPRLTLTLHATCMIYLIAPAFAEPAETLVASECYGGVLGLKCRPGYRIQVVDDFFGHGSGKDGSGACVFKEGDCTVTNSRFTSVIHRYCEGKPSCTNFQVDHRDCGNNRTNYEQVIYKCVPDSAIMNMCQAATSAGKEVGYIATPNFPNEYPPGLLCSCQMKAKSSGGQLQLKLTHFSVQYHSPCKDWAEISLDGHVRRLCGAYSATLRGHALNLTFHSDDFGGHQGLWLEFSPYPPGGDGDIDVQCGSHQPSTSTTTTTTTGKTTTLAPSTTTPTSSTYRTSTSSYQRQSLGSTNTNPHPTVHTTNLTPTTEHKATHTPSNTVIIPTTTSGAAVPSCDNISIQPPEVQGLLLKLCEERRHSDKVRLEDGDSVPTPSRTREIVISSVCVCGVILLIFVLVIVVCLTKRHRAARKAARRQARLQQRLQSLTFYDSVPLCDNLNQRVICPTLTPLSPKRPPLSQCLKASALTPDNRGASRITSDNGPNWTCKLRQDGDSDQDSAHYSEQERRHEVGLTGASNSPQIPSVCAQIDMDYAVSLQGCQQPSDPDEVYTHV